MTRFCHNRFSNALPALMLYLSLICILTSLSEITLFSASIVLKNHKTIEGLIIEEGKTTITVKEFITNKQYTIKRSDIEEIKYDEKELMKKKEQLKKEEPDWVQFTERYKLRAGILPAFIIPTGDVGGALGMGFGMQIFSDILLLEKETSLRAGASLGYASFPVTATGKTGTLTLLPVLAYANAAYPLPSGLRPYGKIGFGLTMASLSGEYEDGESINTSSNDLTLAVSVGTGYTHTSLPRLEFLIDISYMIVFEEVSGNFACLSLGIAYRFDRSGE